MHWSHGQQRMHKRGCPCDRKQSLSTTSASGGGGMLCETMHCSQHTCMSIKKKCLGKITTVTYVRTYVRTYVLPNRRPMATRPERESKYVCTAQPTTHGSKTTKRKQTVPNRRPMARSEMHTYVRTYVRTEVWLIADASVWLIAESIKTMPELARMATRTKTNRLQQRSGPFYFRLLAISG